MGKPRMTRQDSWPNPPKSYTRAGKAWPRPCVTKWRSYSRALKTLALAVNFELPPSHYHLVFSIKPTKKNLKKIGTPHQQRPDKDNLEKGFLDILFKEDSHVWDGRVSKVWAEEGRIDVWVNNKADNNG